MIFGVGCDIIKVARIASLIEKVGDKFLNRIYTKAEVDAGLKLLGEQRNNFFAKRFAAKEAVSKALGTGIGEKISFLDIEITNDANGKPLAKLEPDHLKQYKIHLSLADEDGLAIAYVVAETV